MTLEQKRRLTGQALCGLLIVLVGHVISTQWFASRLHHDPALLGAPAMHDLALDLHLYEPWRFYGWAYQYWGQDLLRETSWPLLFSWVLAGVGVIRVMRRPGSRSTTHGPARFASHEELEERGLLLTPLERILPIKETRERGGPANELLRRDSSSVVLGQDSRSGKVLHDHTSTHVLLVSPTGGGKGEGHVMPTLLTWKGSVFVTDSKGESYAITSRFRERFSEVYYFNPTSEASCGYNPLDAIRRTHPISDVQTLAEALLPGSVDGERERRDVGARSILTMVMLHVTFSADHEGRRHLGECLDLCSQGLDLISRLEVATHEDREVERGAAYGRRAGRAR